MPTGSETALRLMLVDDNVEDAEAIVSGLRNAGIAVRPVRPGDPHELQAMLGNQPVDLVLAAQKGRSIPLEQVLHAVTASGKDLPVVALSESVDESSLADLMAAGVRAIALRQRPTQLLQAVRSQWLDLEDRRNLRRFEAQVRETERRCDALIESSRDPISYIHEGMFIRANSAFLEMFGFETAEDIEGMSLLDLVAPQEVEDFKALLKSLSKGEPPPPRYELTARDASGSDFPAVMEFTPAMYEGEACVQVVFRRQEIDPALAREVEALRQRDQVTGLLNRQTFLRHLDDAIVKVSSGGGQHGLLLVEPDHHQRLMQEIGMDAADAFLQGVANALQKAVGADLPVARFAEHTFAVLVHGDHAATEGAAARILRTFATHVFDSGRHSTPVTVSVGGVQIGEKNASMTQVLGKAHERLQSASAVGGNRSDIFDPGAVDRAEQQRIAEWVVRLRNAIAHDQFVFHYQPVITLSDEPQAVYEAYLRLDAGGGELLPPRAFLQIADENGVSAEIDRWVIEKAIKVAAERLQAKRPVILLAKISQYSLADDTLVAFVQEKLAQHQLPGQYVVLQVAEAKVFSQLRATQALADGLAQVGCRICINQFGSGLDSFQLLSHFKPALLKLDRSFTEELPKNADNQQRIRDITQKAGELGIKTIAEFVQDAASMTILFTAGIDYVQGDFLAPAMAVMNYEF